MKMLKRIIKDVLPYGIVKNHFDKHVAIKTSKHPHLFNEYGEEMIYMYLCDRLSGHLPYSIVSGRIPRRIVWDRYNYGLKKQMYGHIAILNRYKGNDGVKQFGLAVESEAIIPYEYQQLLCNEEKVKTLDALFTCSESLLDKYENAKFTIANGVWYGTELYGGTMSSNTYQKKTKLISIVASKKQKTPLHIFRAEVAKELKYRGIADAMGTSVGTYFDKISDAFDCYMYNVAIENDRKKYYFTEKILDCFASMTIPIYYGASEICKFFNEDGIILLKEPTIHCVLNTLKLCSPQDYLSRLDAIKDNYNRVQQFLSTDDYIVDHYFSLIH